VTGAKVADILLDGGKKITISQLRVRMYIYLYVVYLMTLL